MKATSHLDHSLNTDEAPQASALTQLLQNPISNRNSHATEILIGVIDEIENGKIQLSSLDGVKHIAISLHQLSENSIGKQCAFMLANAMNNQAVIVGLLQQSVAAINETPPNTEQAVDLNYPEGFSIQCGESSLTLNPDGRVEIRGTRIINHARELHRIKAGSVRIN